MTYASISIDRREEYYAKTAKLNAKDPLSHYTRAEVGRQVQARIQAKDLTLARLLVMGRKAGKLLAWRKARA